MLQDQRLRLYIISLTTFVLVASALSVTSFFHARSGYYTNLQQKLDDYNLELSSIMSANAQQFSLLLETLRIGAGKVRPNAGREAIFNHAALKRVLIQGWGDIEFQWNVYSAHLFKTEGDAVYLDHVISGPEEPPKALIQSLAEASRELPAFRIHCDEECYLLRGTPVLFANGSRSVLIMSSSLADIFITFSKNNAANIAIIRIAFEQDAPNNMLFNLFYSNDRTLSENVLQKVEADQADFTVGQNASGLAAISAVQLGERYYANFLIDFSERYQLRGSHKIAVIKDMTKEYTAQNSTMRRNLAVYVVIILAGCALLLTAFWVGITKKFRSLELALASQRRIIEDNVLISTFDGEGGVSSISQALTQHPAVPRQNIQTLADIFAYATAGEQHRMEIEQCLAQNKNWSAEVECTSDTGEVLSLVATISDLENRTSSEDHFTLLFHDITDKKRINHYLEEIKNLDQFRRELIAHVSHDLRTPLTSLRGHIETCLLDLDELNSADLKRMLSVAVKNSAQLSRLVEQLFELSLLSEANVTLELEMVPIAELVQDVLLSFERMAADYGVTLDLHPKDSSILVMADVERIERVFTNLVGNAIRHCNPGASVEVYFNDHSDTEIGIDIVDTGIGIPASDLENIFESYYQASNSVNKKNKNSGLGLAITKRIVTLHGSDIGVTSEVGQGTCFSFTLKKPSD